MPFIYISSASIIAAATPQITSHYYLRFTLMFLRCYDAESAMPVTPIIARHDIERCATYIRRAIVYMPPLFATTPRYYADAAIARTCCHIIALCRIIIAASAPFDDALRHTCFAGQRHAEAALIFRCRHVTIT